MAVKGIKKTIANLVLLTIVFIVMFGFSEMVVRLLFKDQTVLFPRYHTDAQYGDFTLRKIRPKSNFRHTSVDGEWQFTINKQGLRNHKDYEYQKPEGIIRVLSLGDSHTQGYEVHQDYTFSAVIEKYLNVNSVKAEVINAGISGFSTAEELLYLENEGIKYQPDYIVLGFFANDYQDNLKAGFFKLDSFGNLSLQKKAHIPGVKIQNVIYSLPFVKWLSENSYFYSLLFNNTWSYFKTRLAKTNASNDVEYAVPTQQRFSKYQVALASALLERMYHFCNEKNIKLILLDIPTRTNENPLISSLDKSIIDNVERYSDAYVSSETLLSDYAGSAEIHKPHGHHHISAFTHTLFGVEVGKKIIEFHQ